MIHIFTNIVTIQGKGAWGVLQIGNVAVVIGNAEHGPRWYLSLFRPYAAKWVNFNSWKNKS